MMALQEMAVLNGFKVAAIPRNVIIACLNIINVSKWTYMVRIRDGIQILVICKLEVKWTKPCDLSRVTTILMQKVKFFLVSQFIIIIIFFLLSIFLQNCFLCRDCWNGDVMPTLDAALLCSSRAGSDLGRESGLVWGALNHHSAIYPTPLQYWNYFNTQAHWACLIASPLGLIS